MKTSNTSKNLISFKIRFNTMHGNTAFFWRIIIDNQELLATTLQCNVPTRSDASFDENANTIKYHIAGECSEFVIDETGNAFFN